MSFNVLSLSGGGYLGLYTISILAALEEKFGGPIASRFDLIAGTSVGGIIALGLAAEKPVAEIAEAFRKNGTKIFSNRPQATNLVSKAVDLQRSFRHAKYSVDGLRHTVETVVGANLLIGDLAHRVAVPAVNLSKGSPQVFKTPHHPDFGTDYQRCVLDVALATSAAPTYFPIATIGDEMFADGGLFANSPDQIALHEAEHFLGADPTDIHILSIGTTTTQFSLSHQPGLDLGIWGWGTNLTSTIISSQQMLTDYMMQHRLGDRYLRIDAVQSAVQERDLGLDIATEAAQRTIRGLADATVQAVISNEKLAWFLSHNPPRPTFYYGKHANAEGRGGG